MQNSIEIIITHDNKKIRAFTKIPSGCEGDNTPADFTFSINDELADTVTDESGNLGLKSENYELAMPKLIEKTFFYKS